MSVVSILYIHLTFFRFLKTLNSHLKKRNGATGRELKILQLRSSVYPLLVRQINLVFWITHTQSLLFHKVNTFLYIYSNSVWELLIKTITFSDLISFCIIYSVTISIGIKSGLCFYSHRLECLIKTCVQY